MATILSPTNFYLSEVIPEVEYTRKIAMKISDIWAFDRRCNSNIDGEISI